MIGGSGRKLLEISAVEADIANLAPPVMRGVFNAEVTVKFDKSHLKLKVAALNELATAAGRSPDQIEISGFCSLTLSHDRSETDAAVTATARAMGFPDEKSVRNSPSLLIGTPEEVKREISLAHRGVRHDLFHSGWRSGCARTLRARGDAGIPALTEQSDMKE